MRLINAVRADLGKVVVVSKSHPRPRVLFLCTGNSCRSQMAEGWARALRRSEIDAYSAGTHPQGVNPLAVRAMKEAGIDIGGQASKRPEDIGVEFDYVITVCRNAHAICPVFAAKTQVMHVGFDDPALLAMNAMNALSDEEAMVYYRRICSEIRRFVETLPGLLGQAERLDILPKESTHE